MRWELLLDKNLDDSLQIIYQETQNWAENIYTEFENFNLIEAKVPILRFRDRIHQLEVDLNFNNCVGIKTRIYSIAIHNLRSNDFGYVDMNEAIGPYESKNTQPIGELFLYFLEYYSCFDYTQFAISIRTGGILPINVCRLAKSSKNDIHQWKELCIEEPFDLTNTARSVYDFETFERVKAVFMASWRMLQQTLDLKAIFAPIILPTLHHIVSPLSHTVLQYEDSNVSTASEISTRENTTHGSDQNSSTNQSPTVTLLSLTNESNKHASKEINNNSGNRNTVDGSLAELVS